MLLRGPLSLLFWLFVACSSFLLFPIALAIWALSAPFDRRRALLHRFTCFWASLYTWLNPAWPVEIVGREHLDPKQTYVLVANHLSLLDILVLFRLHAHFKWVSKHSNFRVPLIGWNMHLNRYIPLRRGDRESVKQMLAQAEQTLRAGNSLMIFPEGTRSRDGALRPFKAGAFELALKTGLPLLPIALSGTFEALPRRGVVLRGRHPIRVELLPPTPPEAYEGQSAEALMETTRGRILAALEGEGSPAPR